VEHKHAKSDREYSPRKIVFFLYLVFLLVPPLAVIGQDRSLIETQINRWNEDVRRNPKDFETLAAIGSAYGKLGRHAEAIEYFNKAIAVNPSYEEAYLGMAASYGFLGQLDRKVWACKKAIALKPDDAVAYANLGSALGKTGKYKDSADALEQAVRLKPDLADAHFALGLAYLSLGNRSLAIKESDILKRLNSPSAKQLTGLIQTIPKGS
jgi:tetratricopeptide (TPR) repeat protein